MRSRSGGLRRRRDAWSGAGGELPSSSKRPPSVLAVAPALWRVVAATSASQVSQSLGMDVLSKTDPEERTQACWPRSHEWRCPNGGITGGKGVFSRFHCGLLTRGGDPGEVVHVELFTAGLRVDPGGREQLAGPLGRARPARERGAERLPAL